MPQQVVIQRYRTAEGTGNVEKTINSLLQQGWRVVPNTHAVYTDQHAWTTIMVFLEKPDSQHPEDQK